MTDRLGIYFGLAEDDYHADPALGSTDIKDLYHSPPDWQWNRLHPTEPTKVTHLDVGSAVHALVLQGKEAFLDKCVTSPFPDFRKKEARDWRDATLAEGKVILTKDEFDQVIAAAGAILNSPNLQSEFQNGVPEVSVFCEIDGIRQKARFDYLKIRGSVDLKTFAEIFKQSLRRSLVQALANRRYDIQAIHYQKVRAQMAGLFEKGLVFGNAPNSAWLSRVCEQVEPNWVWVFFKTTSAPCAFSVNAMNMRNMWQIAERSREIALEQFVTFRDRFGLDDIWIEEVEPIVLADEDMPGWYAID